MKVKFGEMTVRQVKKICDKTYPSCGNCQLAPNGACLLACSLSDKAISMEYEIDLPFNAVKGIALCRRRNNDTCAMYCSGFEKDCEDYVPIEDN